MKKKISLALAACALLFVAATSFNLINDTQVYLTRFGSIERKFRVNIRDYCTSTNGNGVTDDTAVVAAAYASLNSTNGGEIFFPAGKWRFNLVVNKPNVTIRGVSHVRDNPGDGTVTNCFLAADVNLPIIQWGNDTAVVRGGMISDCLFDGINGGKIGVYLAGGTKEFKFKDSSITHFSDYGLKILSGTNYPVTICHIEGVDGNPHVSANNGRGIFVSSSSAQQTTEIVFTGSHWEGQSGGTNSEIFEVDSCTIKGANIYHDAHHDHGWKLSKSFTPEPIMLLTQCNLDTGGSTNIAIKGYDNARNFSGIISKDFEVSGKWQELDGTLRDIPRTILRRDSAVRGILHLMNTSAGNGNSYIYWDDPVNGKTNVLQNVNGFYQVRAATAFQVARSSDANVWLQVTDATGATISYGALIQPNEAISATAIDWSLGNNFSKTISGNTTFTFTGATAGQWITVAVTASGAFTTSWPTVTWQGGAAPTQTASKTDFYTFYYNGTTYYGSASQNY